MDKYALIGHPVSRSLSPVLFDAAYGGRWTYELVDNPDFEYCWKKFLEEFSGINVTAPFKELALSRADIAHPECVSAGAANIIVKTERGIEAWNSDYLAVKSIIRSSCRNGARVLVVGYGGAGKAAAAAAVDSGAETIICNRSISKAPGIRALDDIKDIASSADLVIYTLPCRIPQIEGLRCRTLLEANYKDPQLAGRDGIGQYISGKEWLLGQAVAGYEFLTGEKPDVAAMTERISQLQ